MTIVEIGIQNLVTHQACIAPGTFVFSPVPRELAFFWTDVFGCEDESSQDKLSILSVLINYADRLARVNTVAECIALQESYCFDSSDYRLYINYGKNYNPLFDNAEYLRALGFSDSRVVYIDDVEYLPLLKDAPKINAQQDMIGYNKLAMGSATTQWDNTSGYLNFIKDLNLFSNDVATYYLEDSEVQERQRNELQAVAYHLIDDVDLSLVSGKISMQDVRAAMNTTLPLGEFLAADYPNMADDLQGNVIPLIIGTVAMVPGICINAKDADTDVIYKISDHLEAIPLTAFVTKEDTWVSVPVYSSDLANGTVTIKAIHALDEQGNPKEMRIGPVTGYANASAPQAIVTLDNLANGVPFTSSFYDMTEWMTEQSGIAPIGFYLDEKTELFELIRMIQEGSSVRFRYEYNANGLRTIRQDKHDRASLFHVNKEEILECGTLAFYTDRRTIAAYVNIKYNKNYATNSYVSVKDSSRAETVLANTRQRPTLEFETFIIDPVVAAQRAADEAAKLGKVRKFCDITLRGKQYLFLKIYDMIDLELYTDKDEWLGLWKCQVLAISPDCAKLQNEITVCLIDKLSVFGENQVVKIDHDGNIMTMNTDNDLVRMAK